MAGVPSSATFSFRGVAATVTGVSVETPVAVTTDMTSLSDPAFYVLRVPTGEATGGTVTVDFLYSGSIDPQSLIGQIGQLSFFSTAYSVARQVILESATVDARVGQVVSGQLKFRMTDYYGV